MFMFYIFKKNPYIFVRPATFPSINRQIFILKCYLNFFYLLYFEKPFNITFS